MGCDINQYRAKIGLFNHFRNRPVEYKLRNQKTEHAYNTVFIRAFILVAVIMNLIVATFLSNLKIPKSDINIPEPDVQANIADNITFSLGYDRGVYTSMIPQIINIAAASLYSMITNFHSRYLYGNKKNQGLKICHWNKGGSHLTNKIPELKNIVGGLHPHIFGVSEANLLHHHDQALVQLEDYNLHLPQTLSNPSLRVSRVVTYTHKSIIAKPRSDLMSDTISSIWLEVGLPRHKRFLVCQTYREWQLLNQDGDNSSNTIHQQLNRWLEFLDQWERALSTGLEVHVVGDMNINHLNWTDQSLPSSNQTSRLRPLITALFTRIFPHGVTQCVQEPTRHWPNQPSSGLDHYYTNRPDKLSPVQAQYRGGSDHMLIFAVRYANSIRPQPSYIRKRSFKNFVPSEFISAINQLSWLDIYLCTDSNSAVELLSTKITSVLDLMAPMKTFQVRTHYNPWLSQETKILIAERERLHKSAVETKDPEKWTSFKALRNKINNRLRSEERVWQKNKLNYCENSSKDLWKNVKNILSWKSSGPPNQLFFNGNLVTKPQEVASSQNEYFLEKIRIIRENLPPPVTDPLAKLRSLMTGRICSFSFSAVHPDSVDKIISGLGNSNSFGLDLIDTKVIKMIRPAIVPALTHIINLSISTSNFPQLWKNAKVIPLHKKDDQLNPKNFRPVAILPVFSKGLERVVFEQIVSYLSCNNLLHPSHHAFRSHHNTTTALIQMYDGWVNAFDAGELSGVCLLDMSAAFDIVDHTILLRKLELYGFKKESLNWVHSYLSGRNQCVSINGSLSRLLPVPVGVPQGSILGPLFYTLFTNELPEVVHHHDDLQVQDSWPPYNLSCKQCGSICCFADDTTFSCSSTSPESLSDQLSDKFLNISNFLVSNRLKLNEDKTHLMVLTSSQTRKARINAGRDISVSIVTPSATITPTSAEKLLGGWVHQDLKWANHILEGKDSLVKSLNTRLSALKLVGRVASFKTRKVIADGIFMSKLVYLISLWGGSEKYLMRSLQTIQNKVARVVTKLGWDTPTEVLLTQCGWLSVQQLAYHHTVVLVHKILQSGHPRYLHNLFNMDYRVKTRQADQQLLKPSQIEVPDHELVTDSFRWRALQNWNALPLQLRTISNAVNFKKQVKMWIKKNTPLR